MISKKRIVVMTDWFAPGYKAGGPIQSCVNFCEAMKNDYQIYVITTDTDLYEEKPYPGVVSDMWTSFGTDLIQVYYFSKVNLNNQNLKKVIRGAAPDFVYLNHMYSFRFVIMPLLFWWRGQIETKIVLCPRGALYASAMHHKGTYLKKIFFLKVLRLLGVYKNVLFHATNEREKEAIQQYFPTDRIVVANNLPNTAQAKFEGVVKEIGFLKLIYIARILPIKNLLFILTCLESIEENVLFSIVGPIEDNQYWEECKAVINRLPVNVQVNCIGPKANNELPYLIRQHHLYVLPTTGENFGHSIFEAFLAGRPVLISDQTPWEALEQKKIGWDISLKTPEEYVKALRTAIRWDQQEFELFAGNAWRFAQNFNLQSMDLAGYKRLFS
jgi:glycosyltransferase involved in cell wall biosynthesis